MRTLLVCALLLASSNAAQAAELKLVIRADFPGGNIIVVKNEGAQIELKPDLRGGQPWFYWHFEATASAADKATFVFPGSMLIGVRGPAVSVDDGAKWHFLGAEHCTYANATVPAKERRETFTYEFKPEHLKVRFAVAIPYLPANLASFVKERAANPNLKQEFLAKTIKGTPVEMLVVGAPGAGREAMIVTARHHACESMASYVLEGFLDEAMSDSYFGKQFRERYVLYAVPLVDRDGVAAGDQGKNRDPHDHNRDYGDKPLYPEIAAIQALGEAQDIKYSIDFHCPALRGDIHEAFHFLGLGTPRTKENLDRFIAWIKEERPQLIMTPLNYLTDAAKPNAVNPKINSHHFALRKNAVFAATLEVPYTQVSPALEPDMAREYGRGMLRAWVRTKFATNDDAAADADEVALAALRKDFLKLYRSKPDEAEALLQPYLGKTGSPVLRAEANNLTALLLLSRKRGDSAYKHAEAAMKDPAASVAQRTTGALRYLQIAEVDTQSTVGHIDECLERMLAIPFTANDQQAKAFESAGRYFEGRMMYPRAIELARRRQSVAASYETGKVLNQISALYDLDGKPTEAIAAREEAVKLLRERLSPKPQRSIFGAMMTLDLFDAVCGIPTSTLAEKQAAAKLALDHEVVAPMYKDRVRKKLADIEAAASK